MKANRRRGAPPWIITYADLMSLLVCFFVLLLAISAPDREKVKVVAGSMRDAFGPQDDLAILERLEIDRLPDEDEGRNDGWRPLDEESLAAIRDDLEPPPPAAADDRLFAEVENQLAGALARNPALKPLAANLQIDEVQSGLRIQLIDQPEKSMFPLASASMYPHARLLLGEVVRAIQAMPHQVSITGHTDALAFRKASTYDNWSLSLDRADATREVMAKAGLETSRIESVIGKADRDLLVPERPSDPRNRRITIILLRKSAAPSPATPPP